MILLISYVLYGVQNIFDSTLIGIAIMLGIGNAFDSVVSGFVYFYMIKKYKINILS